jgi:photosystem II stability/assembly factor-like uncharacterized protein
METKKHRFVLVLIPTLLFSTSFAGWEKLNSGIQASLNCITVHHSSSLGKVWACGDGGRILFSSNGGTSWVFQNSGTSANLYSITFKEVAGGPVFAAGAGGVILRTTDDGATWTRIPSGTTATLRDHSDFGWIIVGDSGIVLRSTDNGLTWARKPTGTTVRLHSVAGAFSLYAVGDNGTVIKGLNGGESWQVVATGAREHLLGVPLFGRSDFAVGSGGLILHSSNNSTSWQIMPSRTNSTLRSVEFSTNNASLIYAVGDNGVVLKTTDAGISWRRQASPTKANLRSVFFYLNDSNGFACGDSGTILRTTDGGGGFIPVADSLEDMFPLAVGNRWEYDDSWYYNILSEQDTYTSFAGRAILTVIGAIHNSDSTRWIMMEETEGRYCRRGWQAETCYTVRGSTTFELIELHKFRHRLYRNQWYFPIKESVVPFGYDLADPTYLYRYWYPDSATTARAVVQDERMLLPSVQYSFVFKTDSGVAAIDSRNQYITGVQYGSRHRMITSTLTDVAERSSAESPFGFKLIRIYPNPFNPTTTIAFSIPQVSFVSLKIFDLLGREVATLVHEEMRAGRYERTFDALHHPSGVYFCLLRAGPASMTSRFILVR